MAGGTGNDIYYVRGAGDLVIEAANEGMDQVRATVDYALTANVENLMMISGGHIGTGNALNNQIIGSIGIDTLYGGDGNDNIAGDDGNDTLSGDNGNDILMGGSGSDVLTGGSGNDIFRLTAGDLTTSTGDTITDFLRGSDRIDLSQLDANKATSADNAFKFIDTQNFHKVAGELRYDIVGGDAYVYGDVNGDGVADFKLIVKGMSALSVSDFTL